MNSQFMLTSTKVNLWNNNDKNDNIELLFKKKILKCLQTMYLRKNNSKIVYTFQ